LLTRAVFIGTDLRAPAFLLADAEVVDFVTVFFIGNFFLAATRVFFAAREAGFFDARCFGLSSAIRRLE
jgi:hypothetical protein